LETSLGNPREQRTVALIVLATLALCAFFLAQGTTGLVAAWLLPFEPTASASAPSRVAVARRTPTSDETILRRNIFDPTTGDVFDPPAIPGTEGEGETVAPVAPWEPGQPTNACNAPGIRLVGAVVSPNAPDWSFAALTGDGAAKAMLFRTGMSIGSNEILEIQRDRVVVRPSGQPACHVAMFSPEADGALPVVSNAAPEPPVAEEAVAEAEQPASEGITNEDLTAGITRVSDTEYTVRRDLVTRLMSNQADLMRMARVIPHEEGGQVVGVKLYGIRRSSLLGRLGVRNGDMVRTINGFDMTSPDAALQAFAQLPTASEVNLALQRRGQDMSMQFNLQD
jgi:general secretion pathway protein C